MQVVVYNGCVDSEQEVSGSCFVAATSHLTYYVVRLQDNGIGTDFVSRFVLSSDLTASVVSSSLTTSVRYLRLAVPSSVATNVISVVVDSNEIGHYRIEEDHDHLVNPRSLRLGYKRMVASLFGRLVICMANDGYSSGAPLDVEEHVVVVIHHVTCVGSIMVCVSNSLVAVLLLVQAVCYRVGYNFANRSSLVKAIINSTNWVCYANAVFRFTRAIQVRTTLVVGSYVDLHEATMLADALVASMVFPFGNFAFNGTNYADNEHITHLVVMTTPWCISFRSTARMVSYSLRGCKVSTYHNCQDFQRAFYRKETEGILGGQLKTMQ